jgi:hypothetical protein
MLEERPEDVRLGGPNLLRHIEIVRRFGVSPVVAINAFPGDHESEHEVIREIAEEAGARVAVTRHVAYGGKGALYLASVVVEAAAEPTSFRFLYELETPLLEKIETVAREVYGADGVDLSPSAAAELRRFERLGYGGFPWSSRRPTCPCRRTRRCSALRPDGACRCARCEPPWARGTSTRSAVRCAPCPVCRSTPVRSGSTSTRTGTSSACPDRRPTAYTMASSSGITTSPIICSMRSVVRHTDIAQK